MSLSPRLLARLLLLLLFIVGTTFAATARTVAPDLSEDDEIGVNTAPPPPPPIVKSPPAPAPPPTDNDMMMTMRAPERIATLEAACLERTKELVKVISTQFTAIVNATLVEFYVFNVPQAYWTVQFPWRCGPKRRDELERATRLLCKPPHSLYVTCDPTVVTSAQTTDGTPVTVIPVRAAVRASHNSLPCDCEAPEWDQEEGLPGHAAALKAEAARIKAEQEVTRVAPPVPAPPPPQVPRKENDR